jgi:hypothetical protein
LTVWLISGLLAWTGARHVPMLITITTANLTAGFYSSFAELGSMIPLNGGAQAYLAYAYGPLISYLYTWTAISLLKPCSAAIISLIFGCVTCCCGVPEPALIVYMLQGVPVPCHVPRDASRRSSKRDTGLGHQADCVDSRSDHYLDQRCVE